MVNLVIKDFTGQAYELAGRSSPPRSSSAKRFNSDAYSTFRFVTTLSLAADQWVQILKATHQHLPSFHGSNPAEVHQAIAQSIMRGDIAVYQLPALNAAGSLQGKNNFGLCLIKGPNPHSATNLVPEVITSPDAAKQLFDNLGISSQAVLAYLANNNLYDGSQKKNPLNDILQKLASGELLAYKLPLPPKSPPAKKVEYVAATGAAYQPVPLAPESKADSGTSTPAVVASSGSAVMVGKHSAAEDKEKISKLSMEADKAAKAGNQMLAKQKIEEARDILRPHFPKSPSDNWDAVVERLDVSSPHDGAVFWSGSPDKAKEFANQIGGVTLETTPGGRIIDNWNTGHPWNEESGPPPWAKDLWGTVSEKYADQISGKVNVIQKDEKLWDPRTIWHNREKVLVMDKMELGEVTSIDIHVITGKGEFKKLPPGYTKTLLAFEPVN